MHCCSFNFWMQCSHEPELYLYFITKYALQSGNDIYFLLITKYHLNIEWLKHHIQQAPNISCCNIYNNSVYLGKAMCEIFGLFCKWIDSWCTYKTYTYTNAFYFFKRANDLDVSKLFSMPCKNIRDKIDIYAAFSPKRNKKKQNELFPCRPFCNPPDKFKASFYKRWEHARNNLIK